MKSYNTSSNRTKVYHDLVLLGRPHRRGHGGRILRLKAGLVAGAAPDSSRELVHHVGDAELGRNLVQVAGLVTAAGAVNVEIQRVETFAVRHHRIKGAESFTLLMRRKT